MHAPFRYIYNVHLILFLLLGDGSPSEETNKKKNQSSRSDSDHLSLGGADNTGRMVSQMTCPNDTSIVSVTLTVPRTPLVNTSARWQLMHQDGECFSRSYYWCCLSMREI